MADGIKKWFMLQVWRIQQVSQVVTIVMLSITLAGVVFDLIQWRLEGSIFFNSWVMIPILVAMIGLVIWTFSIWWDLSMKMWREQATVLVERNPYNKEKMSPKEIAVYGLIWLPVIEKLGETDPKLKAQAEALRTWMSKASREDAATHHDLDTIFKYIGSEQDKLLRLDKK